MRVSSSRFYIRDSVEYDAVTYDYQVAGKVSSASFSCSKGVKLHNISTK